MSHNKRLVEYFSSNFYLSHTINLAHIVSKDFSFRVNGGAAHDFKAFSKRRKLLSQNAKLTIGYLNSDDDVVFFADFVLSIDDDQKATGYCSFSVKDKLIDRVEINYHLDKTGLEIIEKQFLSDTEYKKNDGLLNC